MEIIARSPAIFQAADRNLHRRIEEMPKNISRLERAARVASSVVLEGARVVQRVAEEPHLLRVFGIGFFGSIAVATMCFEVEPATAISRGIMTIVAYKVGQNVGEWIRERR